MKHKHFQCKQSNASRFLDSSRFAVILFHTFLWFNFLPSYSFNKFRMQNFLFQNVSPFCMPHSWHLLQFLMWFFIVFIFLDVEISGFALVIAHFLQHHKPNLTVIYDRLHFIAKWKIIEKDLNKMVAQFVARTVRLKMWWNFVYFHAVFFLSFSFHQWFEQ